MDKSIKEVFKEFCKERHAEDKGRNFNLLQEVYANTEFFDFNFLEKRYKDHLKLFTKVFKEHRAYFPYPNLSLPFANNFVKVSDSIYVFIREYEPNILTGSMYHFKDYKHLNIPFHIKLDGDYSTIFSDFYSDYIKEDISKYIEGLFRVVIETCENFEKISKSTVVVDKPSNPNLCEYYKRKKASAIKVPQRPIYYVLNGNKATMEKQYKAIRYTGTLEYSHAFKVRGHWRHIGEKTLGKDRNGEYRITGYTWVTEYVKGEGELSKRIRVCK